MGDDCSLLTTAAVQGRFLLSRPRVPSAFHTPWRLAGTSASFSKQMSGSRRSSADQAHGLLAMFQTTTRNRRGAEATSGDMNIYLGAEEGEHAISVTLSDVID
jgi:hypothetical protein